MPNQRASHIGQVSLVIDKKIIRDVDALAKCHDLSRNRTIEMILRNELPDYLARKNNHDK